MIPKWPQTYSYLEIALYKHPLKEWGDLDGWNLLWARPVELPPTTYLLATLDINEVGRISHRLDNTMFKRLRYWLKWSVLCFF